MSKKKQTVLNNTTQAATETPENLTVKPTHTVIWWSFEIEQEKEAVNRS
jgi:hypothetical protein